MLIYKIKKKRASSQFKKEKGNSTGLPGGRRVHCEIQCTDTSAGFTTM